MASSVPRARPAHAPGPTYLSYTPNGRSLITAGTNDAIRIFDTGSDGEPTNVDGASENNLAVVASNDFFVTGSEDGRVSKFALDSHSFDSVLVRCSLPIRHLALSANGEWLAVASDELVVKVVNTSDMDRVTYLREQTKAVKHVSFDPAGTVLAVSCTDGIVYFYGLDTPEPQLLRKVDSLIRPVETDDFASSETVWHPDGRAFAAATASNDIQVMSFRDWAPQRSFKGGHAGDITAMAWSPNGALLVSAGRDKKICLWDTRTQRVLRSVQTSHVVLAFQWHPTDNVLSYTNDEGELYMHEAFVPDSDAASLRGRLQPAPFLHEPLAEISGNAARSRGEPAREKPAPRRRERQGTPNSLDDMLASVDGSDSGFIEDDDGAGYVEEGLNDFGKRPRTGDEDFSRLSKRQIRSWQPQLHDSFQPGSTPWRGDRKYLCLNLVGLVWTIEYEQYCTITVEYYDRSFQRDFHFTDPFHYEEACLTEKGILFASHPRNDQPASIYYRPHEHWTTERPDWRITLPEDEDIVAIALSESFAVVSTTADYLRVYTLAGTPYRMYRQKSSPLVTCTSWRDYVMTIGNGPVGGDGQTKLTYSILNVKRDEACQSEDSVALPANAQLRNVFFSDSGDPCIYDTTGTLLTLLHWRVPGQALWVPLLDTKRLSRLASGKRSENYWPVAVADGKFHCVILKGNEKHPFFPRPLLSDFDFEVPIVPSVAPKKSASEDDDADDEPENKVKALEEAYVKASVLHGLHTDLVDATHATSAQRAEHARQELEIDKTLLQLVWECCVGQDERQGIRALELVGLMRDRSGKMVDGAGKIASRFGLDVLRQKIEELAERRLVGLAGDDE